MYQAKVYAISIPPFSIALEVEQVAWDDTKE